MKCNSTRGGEAVSAAQAIVRGISPTGGLYVPSAFPFIAPEAYLHDEGYCVTARNILRPFLEDTSDETLLSMLASAYASFDTPEVTPLRLLTDTESVAELWHGPTMAFKDVALQLLPRLLTNSLKLTGETKEIYILVATSGDTGKAALAGFANVPGTRVLVFYPDGGVSEMQRLQMVTQEGDNVDVCAVRGNFDDAQTGVKRIFTSADVAARLEKAGYRLSSANSINLGRLIPQIVYYFVSYAKLVAMGRIRAGEKINFCVPTGNFGDILAGEYARRMGLPVRRLICASNRNNVLADFFRTGVYDDRRPFYQSMSCSIDILISSNLERLLYETAGHDTALVSDWMRQLRESGRFDVGAEKRDALAKIFCGAWCGEEDTLATIKKVYEEKGDLMDPHTAVAQTVYERYAAEIGDTTQTVLLSTANPYKFATAVLGAFEPAGTNDFDNAERLHALTGAHIPAPFTGLKQKRELHTGVCALSEMASRVLTPAEGK